MIHSLQEAIKEALVSPEWEPLKQKGNNKNNPNLLPLCSVRVRLSLHGCIHVQTRKRRVPLRPSQCESWEGSSCGKSGCFDGECVEIIICRAICARQPAPLVHRPHAGPSLMGSLSWHMRNSTGASRRGGRTPACSTYGHFLPTKAGNAIQPRTERGVPWFREHSAPLLGEQEQVTSFWLAPSTP